MGHHPVLKMKLEEEGSFKLKQVWETVHVPSLFWKGTMYSSIAKALKNPVVKKTFL